MIGSTPFPGTTSPICTLLYRNRCNCDVPYQIQIPRLSGL